MSNHPPSGGGGSSAGDDPQKKTHFWYIFPVPKTQTPLLNHQLTVIVTAVSAGAILLPPRTFGRNAILGAFTLLGVSQLRYDWTGQTWAERKDPITKALEKAVPMSLPDGAKAAQTQIRREKELRRIRQIQDQDARKEAMAWLVERERELERIETLHGDKKQVAMYMLGLREAEEAEKRGETKEYGFWKRLWMGGEKEGWELKRWKEHREILERGEGLWGAIKHDINDAIEMVVGKPPDDDENEDEVGKNTKKGVKAEGEKEKKKDETKKSS